ncbi:hypothetical protein [Spirochaeta isovalerica]|uniref:Outer membrane protein beta-barrel domain-containing protein n=1 Tax=Spirochaeta isovalerica TaxID=150 RepID=A0A841REE1_9SPIO|nr:hypothetical protein [Spirochaeta isovalerica]MBB6481209.1 hypothetical protein [Spirochaeta isovalerica]
MKKLLVLIIVFVPLNIFSLQLSEELAVGYYNDLGVTLGLRLDDSESDFPLFIQVRSGASYQFEPGNAEEARKIFINDNQGGNIQEYGLSLMVALDAGWKIPVKDNLTAELTVSGLINHYQAHFAFIGNNEAFSVKSTGWGVGLGGGLRMGFSRSRTSISVKAGLEFFPKTRIDAHGTFYYNPDGLDDSPRQDYTYDDADSAINQPFFRPYVQVGFLFPVGS